MQIVKMIHINLIFAWLFYNNSSNKKYYLSLDIFFKLKKTLQFEEAAGQASLFNY